MNEIVLLFLYIEQVGSDTICNKEYLRVLQMIMSKKDSEIDLEYFTDELLDITNLIFYLSN